MSKPKRHHYVHISYQKRFLATENELYVLSNEYNKNLTLKTPSQICYAMNLHTLDLNNAKFLEIESFYSSVEGEIAKMFAVIDDEEKKHKSIWLSALKLPNAQTTFKFFVSIMFWRNPCQTELAKKYSENLVELYDAAHEEAKKIISDRKTIIYIQKHRHKEDFIKIIQFLLLPLITFKIWDKNISIGIAHLEEQGLIVTCDNPVVFKTSVENLFNFEDFYLPLDKNRLLTNTINKEFSIRVVDINLKTAMNSKKYIMGASEEMMNYIKDRI